MKKPLIVLSIVCASALALADSAQYNAGWFKGIGDNVTSTNDMKAVNGSWQFPATEGCATVNEGALVLALDEDDDGKAEEATFKIDTAASETDTAQRLSVTGVFNPISAEDLLSGTQMNKKEAQVGFAVVGEEAAEGAMTYKYYAWVGETTGGATAAADWVELSGLGEVADPAAQTALTIELNYWNAGEMTATFKIGNKSDTKTLASAAAQNKKIASVSCTGSGTLSALNGAYQYAVAQANGKKYPTVEAAVASGASEVKLLQPANGSVPVAGDVTIDSNGKGVPAVTKNDNTKEFASGTAEGVVTVQTKAAILEKIAVGPASKTSNLMKDEAKFRDFLNKHCLAYRAAGTTADAMTADIQTALNTKDSTSKRPLWQSYALGVEPDAVLKLTQVAKDVATDGITLKFPGTPSGDFTITYKVTDGTEAGTMTVTDATAVKVPLKTGHYAVKISFE